MKTKCQGNTLSSWNKIPLSNIDNSIRQVCQNCADVRQFYECFSTGIRKPFSNTFLYNNNAVNACLGQRQPQQQYGNYFMRMAHGTTCNPEYLQYFFTTPEHGHSGDHTVYYSKHRIPFAVIPRISPSNIQEQNRDDKHTNNDYPTNDSMHFTQFPDAIRKHSKFPKSWFRDLHSIYWRIGAEYDIDPRTKQFIPRFKNNMPNYPEFLQNILNYGFSEKWMNDLYERFISLDDEAAEQWLSKLREIGGNTTTAMQGADEASKCCDDLFCGYCQPISIEEGYKMGKKGLTQRSSMWKYSRSTLHGLRSRPSIAFHARNKEQRRSKHGQKTPLDMFQIPFHRPFDPKDQTTFSYKGPHPVMAANDSRKEKLKVTITGPEIPTGDHNHS